MVSHDFPTHSDSRATQVMELIARQGPLTTGEIVRALRITTTAVRQHLNRLMWAGWLVRDRRREGPGRPADVFSLSEKAKRAYAHEVDDFARLLVEEIAASEGTGKLDSMLQRVSRRLADGMEAQAGSGPPKERVETLVHALQQRGTVTEAHATPAGLQLSVYTCPFYGLGEARRQICEAERQTLSRLGGGTTHLKQSMMNGQSCCEFEVQLADTGSEPGQ